MWCFSSNAARADEDTLEFRTEPGESREHLDAIRFAWASQRASMFAASTIPDDDIYWDENSRRDWFGVRTLQHNQGNFSEHLTLVALPVRAGSQNRVLELLEAMSAGESEVLELESQDMWIPLNNELVFQVRRRSGLTDQEYVERYSGT